jgi:branched-chain amino acid transport system permease protein
MSSIGLASLIEGIAMVIFGGEARMVNLPVSGAIRIGGLFLSYPRLATLGISLVVFGVFLYVVYFTKFGRALRATGSDPEMAQVQGINISRIYFFTFCIGTVLAGIGGIVACHMTPPALCMGMDFSSRHFVSLCSRWPWQYPGAVVGALIIGLLRASSAASSTDDCIIVSFVVVLFILLVRPVVLWEWNR